MAKTRAKYSTVSPEHELDDRPSDPKKPMRPPALPKVSVLRWWSWELAMSGLSLASFTALICVLGSLDGSPERRWGPLTLNTVNAILSTAISSLLLAFIGPAMSQHLWNGFAQSRNAQTGANIRPAQDLRTFDEASRGPWGSVKLLLRLGFIDLTTLGAIVTLLNLAFLAFTQQLISTKTLPRYYTEFVQPFPRSRTYSAPALYVNNSVDYATKSAIIAASLQGNNAAPLQLACSSGTCTYQRNIPTLALCGGCTNITDRLDNRGTCDWTVPSCPESTTQCTVKGNVCAYKLPNGHQLRFQPGFTSGPGLWSVWNVTNVNSGSSVAASVYDDSWYNYVMKFSAIGLPISQAVPILQHASRDPQAGGTLPAMVAQECALWFCLNTYDVSMESNHASINLTHSTARMSSSGIFDAVDGPFHFLDIPSEMGIETPSEYSVSGSQTLADELAQLTPEDNSYVSGPIQEGQLVYGGNSDSGNPNLIEGLYHHSDNLANWTDNLAQTMINRFASLAPAEATQQEPGYLGVNNLVPVSHFKIRWYWITLPVTVILLAHVFLVLTIFQTQHKAVLPWKADPLMLAVVGCDEDVRNKLMTAGSMSRPEKLHETARKTEMGLWHHGRLVFAASPESE